MSKVLSKRAAYQVIALQRLRGREITIDEMREIYEAEGFWTAEELAEADREWKNAELRRLARLPFHDEEGNRRELVNIKRADHGSDERQQFFAFLDEIKKEDFELVIKDRIKKRDYFTSESRRLIGVYSERFGKAAANQLQRRLQLDFD